MSDLICKHTKWSVTGVLAMTAGAALAFPDKPVTIIVPFTAGTTNDVNARDFAQGLAAVAKQPVVVDNRTGAEGANLGQRGLEAYDNPCGDAVVKHRQQEMDSWREVIRKAGIEPQ